MFCGEVKLLLHERDDCAIFVNKISAMTRNESGSERVQNKTNKKSK
jgi:hypothetical protein